MRIRGEVEEEEEEEKKDSIPQNLFPEFTLLTFLPTAVFNVLTFSHKG